MNGLNILALGACVGLLAGCEARRARPAPPAAYQSRVGPLQWSDWANLSLNAMLEKYGPPTRIESKRVVWEEKGPWKRVAVWDAMEFDQARDMADNIEETVAYLVPSQRRAAVRRLSARVKVSPDGSELSSRSFSEDYNFLALNLADEVIRGVRTPDEANDFYDATLRLAAAGKSSRYMSGLLFESPTLPDEP